MSSLYFSGQGKLYAAVRNTDGTPNKFMYLGNAPELKLTPKSDNLTHQESTTGQRSTDLKIQKAKSCEVSFKLEHFTKDLLALGLYGAAITGTTGSVTAEAFPLALVAGDHVALKHPSVSTVVIKDSAGTPATLVAGTDYIVNPDTGGVDILNVGTYVQPFKADYAYGIVSQVGMFTQPIPERYLRFEGLNTANDNKPVLVEVFRASLDPLDGLDLISETITSYGIKGDALQDGTKLTTDPLGQFVKITIL